MTPRHWARMDAHGLPRAPTGHHILARISGKYINDPGGKHHMLTHGALGWLRIAQTHPLWRCWRVAALLLEQHHLPRLTQKISTFDPSLLVDRRRAIMPAWFLLPFHLFLGLHFYSLAFTDNMVCIVHTFLFITLGKKRIKVHIN